MPDLFGRASRPAGKHRLDDLLRRNHLFVVSLGLVGGNGPGGR